MKSNDNNISKSIQPIPSHIKINNPLHIFSKKKSQLNSINLPLTHYSQCDNNFNEKNVFICQVHSTKQSNLNLLNNKTKTSYRMAIKPQLTYYP